MKKRVLAVFLACAMVVQNGLFVSAEALNEDYEVLLVESDTEEEMDSGENDNAEEAAAFSQLDETAEEENPDTAGQMEEEVDSDQENENVLEETDEELDSDEEDAEELQSESETGDFCEGSETLEFDGDIVIEEIVEVESQIAYAASSASGTCGENVSWSLENGVLTVSGSGAMDDYTMGTCLFNKSTYSTISEIVVEEGVTYIGKCAFANSSAVSVTLPDGLLEIGGSAFYGAASLESIVIPNSVTSIGAGAFSDCTSLS